MADITNPEYSKFRQLFINDLQEKGRSEATVIAYAKDIEQILKFLIG